MYLTNLILTFLLFTRPAGDREVPPLGEVLRAFPRVTPDGDTAPTVQQPAPLALPTLPSLRHGGVLGPPAVMEVS